MGKKKAEKKVPVKRGAVVKQDKLEKPVASRTKREKTKEKPIETPVVDQEKAEAYKPIASKGMRQCAVCDTINPSLRVTCSDCAAAMYDFGFTFKSLNKRFLDAVEAKDKDSIASLKSRIEKDVKATYGIYKVASDGTAVRMKTATISEDGQVVSKKREPGAPRKGKVMAGYGHGEGTQGAAIDAAVAKGGTIEDIAKASGVSKARAKAHIAHLIKEHKNVKIEIVKNKYVAKEIKA